MNKLTYILIGASIIGFGALQACKETNTAYCDATRPCTSDPAKPYCDQIKHECVSTPIGGDDMSTSGFDLNGIDLFGRDLAGLCGATTDCASDATPICDVTCRACTSAADDTQCAARSATAPRCNTTSGTCVQCNANTDCTDAAKPACGSNNVCRKCQAHSECASAVCDLTAGTCVDPSMISYVDNRGMTVALCNGNATLTKDGNSFLTAFCDVAPGINNGRPYVAVKGSLTQYPKLSINGTKTVTIVGPGKSAATPAVLYDATMDIVTVSPGGSDVTVVTLDGMTIGLPGNTAAGKGVVCNIGGSSSGTLTLRDVMVQSMQKIAVSINDNCDFTMRQSTLRNNTLGALSISGTAPFVVENNFIVANVGTVIAVTLSTNQAGTFNFNTVAGNAAGASNAGALACVGTHPITNSIVAGNTTGSGTQITGTCVLTSVVTGTDSFAGATMAPPEFVDTLAPTYDAHLKASSALNATCCVDKITGAGLPAVDIDGSTRPKGVSWDIGAHEVQ